LLIDSCITQLKAQGPSRTCNESKGEEEDYFLPESRRTLNPYTPQPLNPQPQTQAKSKRKQIHNAKKSKRRAQVPRGVARGRLRRRRSPQPPQTPNSNPNKFKHPKPKQIQTPQTQTNSQHLTLIRETPNPEREHRDVHVGGRHGIQGLLRALRPGPSPSLLSFITLEPRVE